MSLLYMEGSKLAWEFNTYLTMTGQRRWSRELDNNIARRFAYGYCVSKESQARTRRQIKHCRDIVEHNRYDASTAPGMYTSVSLDLVWKTSARTAKMYAGCTSNSWSTPQYGTRGARITRDNWKTFASKRLNMLFVDVYPDPVTRFEQMLIRGASFVTPALFDCVLCAFEETGGKPDPKEVTNGPVLNGSGELALHVLGHHPELVDRKLLRGRPLLLHTFDGLHLRRAQAADTLRRAWRGYRATKLHVQRLRRAQTAATMLALAWRCWAARQKLKVAKMSWRHTYLL